MPDATNGTEGYIWPQHDAPLHDPGPCSPSGSQAFPLPKGNVGCVELLAQTDVHS